MSPKGRAFDLYSAQAKRYSARWRGIASIPHAIEPGTVKGCLQPPVALTCYAGIVAFCTYSCVYAFRKGFAVSTYNYLLFGMQAKVVFLVSQLLGYTLSKFWGIRFISGLQLRSRIPMIIGLNLMAWFALLCFALAQPPLKVLCMFATGLLLGLIWDWYSVSWKAERLLS